MLDAVAGWHGPSPRSGTGRPWRGRSEWLITRGLTSLYCCSGSASRARSLLRLSAVEQVAAAERGAPRVLRPGPPGASRLAFRGSEPVIPAFGFVSRHRHEGDWLCRGSTQLRCSVVLGGPLGHGSLQEARGTGRAGSGQHDSFDGESQGFGGSSRCPGPEQSLTFWQSRCGSYRPCRSRQRPSSAGAGLRRRCLVPCLSQTP